jgi:hypothetical protein
MFRTSSSLSLRCGLAPLAGLALAGLASCSDTSVEPQILRTALGAIEGGVVDENNTSVMGVFSQSSGGSCSGTLIAPNLFLTAQHCVAEVPTSFVICGRTQFGSVYPASGFVATTNVSLFAGFRDGYSGSEVYIPPGDRDLCGQDIALIILDGNVPESETIPYVPRIDEPVSQGEEYVAVGYGQTASGGGAGTRRIIENRFVQCNGEECDPFGSGQVQFGEWVGSDGTCQGDSGGPALDDQLRVIGVLSRGADGCRSSTYTGIAENADWLREVGRIAAERGGYTAPLWVTQGISEVREDADGDLVDDSIDNCFGIANADQSDVDGDGLGDLCDDRDDRDRGGTCTVCNGCSLDSECGDGGRCVNLGSGGVCTFDCEGATDCPGNTDCFDVPGPEGTQSLCLNQDAGAVGVCAEAFVCGSEVVTPGDGCDICAPCVSDDQCAGGLCLDFGSGSVCTSDCATEGCPGDARCYEVSGRNVCLNPDAAGQGVCPATYACSTGEPEGGAGGGNGGAVAEPGTESPSEPAPAQVFSSTSGSGCASSAGPGAPASSAVLMLLALLGLRRRA